MPGLDDETVDLPIPKPSLDDLTRALKNEATSDQAVVSSTIVYGLSELRPEEERAIAPCWNALPAIAKHRVLRALNEASEAMFELCFREIALLSLEDASSLIRSTAIELLWIDESAETMQTLMRLAKSDSDVEVRTRALEQLGRFLLLGEYGDIPAEIAAAAQELTYGIYTDSTQALVLRRRALEALANSSHPKVNDLIAEAYADGNHELRVGALFAMGRTCSAIWRDQLMRELESVDSECAYEAIRACGHIQLREAARRIADFTHNDDQEIRLIAIWSLGEIGGRHAFDILSSLEESAADDDIAAALEEALDTASFSLGFASLGLESDDA